MWKKVVAKIYQLLLFKIQDFKLMKKSLVKTIVADSEHFTYMDVSLFKLSTYSNKVSRSNEKSRVSGVLLQSRIYRVKIYGWIFLQQMTRVSMFRRRRQSISARSFVTGRPDQRSCEEKGREGKVREFIGVAVAPDDARW